MSDTNLFSRPDVTFDFNLPHGMDMEDNAQKFETSNSDHDRDTPTPGVWSLNQLRDYGFATTTATLDCKSDQLNYRQFSPGLSDHEGSGEAFKHSWSSHLAKKQSTKVAKCKRFPRRSKPNGERSESSVRAKKPRPSLFGRAVQEMGHEGRDDNVLTPATPGFNIDNHISSLQLDQQQVSDGDMERVVNTDFGLACSDIGSVHSSPALSDDGFSIRQNAMPYYELRQNIDRKKAVTHVDNDKSGNFDPDQEAKDRSAKLIRARAAKKERKEKKEKQKRKGKSAAPPDYLMKCVIRLPFRSFGNVRNITNDEQNWPEDWSEIDSEQERELREFREHYRAKSPDSRQQLPLEDPAGQTDDLTGHPAARGCKQCRRLEQACSLVNGGRYPCEECTEDGGECEPIQKPTMKGRCKQCCSADEEVCSLEIDPRQQMCNHCIDSGHVCEPLPPHGYKAPRMAVDGIVWGPNRPHITCTTCRRLKKRCSLKTKQDIPPCKWCKKSSDPCRFVDPPEPGNQKQTLNDQTLLQRIAPDVAQPNSEFFTEEDLANMYHFNDKIMERESTPKIEMEDAEGNKGMLTRITTSFAHPIKFSTPRSEPMGCNFCEIPIFGMFGHFEREVHVIRWHSGLGFSEVGGGHAQNEGTTAMCSDCTNQRLQIMLCPGHNFERFHDAVSDHDALAEELIVAEPGGAGMRYQLSRWCSICFSPAVFGCSTVQPDLCGDEEKDIAGCHLRLCLPCEMALRTRFGGVLDALATDFDAQPKVAEADETLGRQVEGRPRADVGFLMYEGLLMRVLQANG
ncbi:hypothetical protein SVAN01_10713 [Stagonosporopsis vannaccii]|nr:hypothetical protein SVAN01_10713 [Stagonosporopsis vannaccii]